MNWLREANAEPLPGYRLIRPLGTGGFGEVWLCEAPGGIHKAIKFVYGNLHAEDGGNVRAEQEYRALQKVKEVRHPFVLTIERIDVCDGELVIVMELAEKSLHDCLVEQQEAGRLGINREVLLGYLSDAADGLDYLIDRYNLLHLDVKPRNLFLVGNHVKVADFGLVKNLERQNNSGLMGGMSPQYAAPETFTNNMSRQSDQYSLAIVYMELLTGQRPFNARSMRQLALQHMSEDPDLRPLPERDRPVIARALAKDPARRFPNCLSFVRALGGIIGRPDAYVDVSAAVPVRPPGPDEMTPPTAPRFRAPPVSAPETEGDNLQHTMAQAEVGTLRPAVFVGVGSFGLLALKELRKRLVDRVGDLGQLPSFRFIYLDTDPDAVHSATQGSGDQFLRDDQVFPLRLQPVTNYRRRILDHLNEWLPREKLYSIPRSLQTLGSRALGRLAFCDNFLRFDTRFTREVQIVTHPESLAQSITQSGMTLRDNCPRVFVLASALGGSSGMLADIGFAVRRKLEKMQFPKAPVTAFLFCGAPHDPTVPKQDLANLAATLTELNHFHDPAITFSAQYGGPDGPKIVAQEYPFSSVYLMERESRGPDAPEQCAVHLAGYLVQDLTSPLGGELDRMRGQPTPVGRLPFRSFGAAGIWFPRGLLLRAAARIMCQRLLLDWQEAGPLHSYKPVDDLCNKMQATPALRPEAISERLTAKAATGSEPFAASFAKLIADLEQGLPGAGDDPGSFAKVAVERVASLVGGTGDEGGPTSFLHSRATRSFNIAVQELANDFSVRLFEYAIEMMEVPGKRIAATEAALYRMGQLCARQADQLERAAAELAQKASAAWAEVRSHCEVCVSGSGFRLFGGSRTARSLRNLVHALQDYGQARLREQAGSATVRFYRSVQAGLDEKVRDLGFCRQRLATLEQVLEPEPTGSYGGSNPGLLPTGNSKQGASLVSVTTRGADHVLLPFGESDIEWAAARFVMNVTPEQWTRLEEVLQSLVLTPLGGLHTICQRAGDSISQLAGPLIDQTTAYLNKILEIADVAEGDFVAGGKRANVVTLVQECWEKAKPLVAGDLLEQQGYLVVPGTEAGNALSEDVREALPSIKILQTVGQTSDIMVCREQAPLAPKYLEEMLQHCRDPYRELSSRPSTSPHSRFDILEWTPLDV